LRAWVVVPVGRVAVANHEGLMRNGSPVNFKVLDTYDATRLLLVPSCLQPGEEVAAVIPDRDTLCVTRVPEDGDWSPLVELARIPSSDRLLLDRPARVTSEGFELK